MNWYQNPPPYPYYQPPMPPDGNREYIRYLRKELKLAKGKDKEIKKEEKKIWWKRAEVTAALFFLSPFIVVGYIGAIKISWLLLANLIH